MKTTFLKIILTAGLFSAIAILNVSCGNVSTSSKSVRDSTDTSPPKKMVATGAMLRYDSTDTNPPKKIIATGTALNHDSTDGNPPAKKMKKVNGTPHHDSTHGNPPK